MLAGEAMTQRHALRIGTGIDGKAIYSQPCEPIKNALRIGTHADGRAMYASIGCDSPYRLGRRIGTHNDGKAIYVIEDPCCDGGGIIYPSCCGDTLMPRTFYGTWVYKSGPCAALDGYTCEWTWSDSTVPPSYSNSWKVLYGPIMDLGGGKGIRLLFSQLACFWESGGNPPGWVLQGNQYEYIPDVSNYTPGDTTTACNGASINKTLYYPDNCNSSQSFMFTDVVAAFGYWFIPSACPASYPCGQIFPNPPDSYSFYDVSVTT